ncbi:hypothetical protein [Niabella ginsengisoli]|uniref:Uncharacterized protein n=1 Tax=Niabella ginsengisoli TaxID=522298 RepID=A0ABS9SE68_9BACT|nr:hypothetical protein [Niabella ginsengisoli]MCH5596657.1 hypothetical protein [Niabella ginsengisoli]
MKSILFFVVLFMSFIGAAGQNPYIDSLLIKIENLQIVDKNTNYNVGMFPSQRVYRSRKMPTREDDNIFFTGLIVWTLKSVRSELSVKNQAIVDAITEKATPNYVLYQNKDGRPVYNFWQTKPSRHFPNSKYFSSRKKYIIPDDLDDTAILYLSTAFSDSLKNIVKTLMAENANGRKYTVRNTFKRYKRIPAYSTWFGKNMPVDFDICVQANALRFVLDNQFELNKYDSATIQLVRDMVLNDTHLKRAAYVSPHYQNPNIILYHLARLVAAHPQHPLLDGLKSALITDLKKQMHSSKSNMERVLLQTSLLKLEEPFSGKISVSEKDRNAFYFFVANMTSVFPNPIKGIFVKSRKTNFFYRSQAYYLTLLLENEVLRRGVKIEGT